MSEKEINITKIKEAIINMNSFFEDHEDHKGVKLGLTVDNTLVVLNYSEEHSRRILKLSGIPERQQNFRIAKLDQYRKSIRKYPRLANLPLEDGTGISENILVPLEFTEEEIEDYGIDKNISGKAEDTDIEIEIEFDDPSVVAEVDNLIKKKEESKIKKELIKKNGDLEKRLAGIVDNIQGRTFLMNKDWLFHYEKRKIKKYFFPREVYINPQQKLLNELEYRLPNERFERLKRALTPLIKNNNTIVLSVQDKGCIDKVTILSESHKETALPLEDEFLEPIVKYFNEVEDKGIYIKNLQVSKNYAKAMFSGATIIEQKQDFPNIEADSSLIQIFVKYGLVKVIGVPFLPLISRAIYLNFETHCGFMGKSLLKEENAMFNPNYEKLARIYRNSLLENNIHLNIEGIEPPEQMKFTKELIYKLTVLVNDYYDKSLKYDLLLKNE
ncbi:hypothetical protein MA785_000819 [Vibrio parahaemolyticus]|nr:hypothetical protein [Vibrio parahaemolyticus]EJR2787928.1 hypothetical protein [Vibrio parahaemolyticus]